MALAFKCDRCGSYFDSGDHQHQPDMYRVYRTHGAFTDTSVGLCPACHERFNVLINSWLEPEQVMMKPAIVDKPEECKKKRWWRK